MECHLYIKLILACMVSGSTHQDLWRIAVIFEEPWMFSGDVLRMLRRAVLELGESCPSRISHKLPDRLWYQKDAVSKWVARGVMGVVYLSRNKSEDVSAIMEILPSYGLPSIEIIQNCTTGCITVQSTNGSNVQILEEIATSIFRHYLLQHTIIVQGHDGIDSSSISQIFASAGLALSHIYLHSNRKDEAKFLYQQIKDYYAAWNLPDNTDDGRVLIALTKHKAVKEVILKMLENSMFGSRTKFLIMDDLEKWRNSLSNITSYVADIGIITDSPLLQNEFPLSVQVLLDDDKTQFKPNCSYNYVKRSEFGQLVLNRINDKLIANCCRTEDKWYYLWRGYPVDNGKQTLHPVAAWSRSFGFLPIDSIRKKNIPNLRVAIKSYPPLINITVEGNNVTLWPCMGKDILDFISHKLGISYELVVPLDEYWGSKENGSWNGAIRMILDGDADVIPYLAFTTSRAEVLDFTHPLLISENGILVKKPVEPPRALLFLRPFTKEVWFAILISVLVISVIFYIINYASAYAYGQTDKHANALCCFSNCFWYILGAMLQQGGIHTPSSISGRLVAGTWWLAVLVIFSTYSGNLIAFLTFPETRWLADSLNDVIENKDLLIVVGRASPIREEMQKSNSTIMRLLSSEFLKRGKLSKWKSNIKRLVKRGKAVYLDDANYIRAAIAYDFTLHHDCHMILASQKFYQMEMSMGMRRGSPYFKPINDMIQALWEVGLLSHWNKKYNVRQELCEGSAATKKGGGRNVNLKDMEGAFYLLCLGLIAGIIIAVLEIITRLFHKNESKIKEMDEITFARQNRW